MATMQQDYAAFLASKMPAPEATGVRVADSALPARLFDYQRHCAAFAIERGRAGIYLDTGLGKSAIELTFAEQAAKETGRPSLVLAPLAVGPQMAREAAKFGVEAKSIREQSEAAAGVCICNYDRLHKLSPDEFGAVILDEASILKSFTGKTTASLISAFRPHRFKLAATATPAPNDHMELGQQSQFLGVMDSNEMLMRWFTADQTEMGRYRLKGHGERDFWDWMASWSRMAENPEDLGFDGSRFILPPLSVVYHRAETEVAPPEGALFQSVSSATEIHDVKRQTAEARAELAAQISDGNEPVVIWCDTNYESDALMKLLPGAIEVRGSQSIEEKEELLEAFAGGEARVLITKPSICGFGLNWQHCSRMIFAGRTFSYESYYQAVRRCWRFGQSKPVTAHIIIAEGEEQIACVIDRKAEDHIRMKGAMSDAMRRSIIGARKINYYKPTFQGELPSWLSIA